MAKIKKQYLKVHPFKLIEKGFYKDRDMVSESLFSLANEYSGIRGFFDEDYSSNQLIGTYYNGIIEYGEEIHQSYKGIAKRTHFTINSTNWVKIRIKLDDEILDLNKSNFANFRREIDFRDGKYIREFVWLVKDNKINIRFERLLSMTDVHEGAVRLTISSDKELYLDVDFILDASIKHWGKNRYYKVIDKDLNIPTLVCQTLTTEQYLATSMHVTNLDNKEIKFIDDQLIISSKIKINEKKKIIDRLVINNASKVKIDPVKLKLETQNELESLIKKGFDSIYQNNKKYFFNVYKHNDIVINGDKVNQQGIRFCLFQLEQTYHGIEKDNNIGAKGLTGEAYSGHAFWDSETYCLPYYLFNNKEASKDLLLFRYNTLEEAKKRAKDLDCEGACFPIATRTGEEACTLWQHASCQFQPSTAVSYAIEHYMNVYNDHDFMQNYGIELLIEISKFLLSRGEYSKDKKYFGFYGVMGPDEFQLMVNHNTYTNYMAKKTFDYLLKIKKDKSYNFIDIENKCEINNKFYSKIKKARDHMLIIYDEKTKLFEQHDGFFKLPHIDVDKIPDKDFPLYSNWSYDRIYRNDMIKQPDVLMFMLLYNQDFTFDQLKANYEYYEPLCIHESSLSPSVHSVIANQIGKEKEAYNFFRYATRLDLDDYNNNTKEGIHMTSIAAAWLNIVYGFGGFRSDKKVLSIAPTLPKKWKSYSFNLNIQGNLINFFIDKNELKITNNGNKKIKMKIYNHLKNINEGVTIIKR
ncbi:MAG: glycoside hydrolase family 65 protein [Bacilli bacterium]